MLTFFRNLKNDLSFPSDDPRFIEARKKALLLLSVGISFITGISMAYLGYSLVSTLLAGVASFALAVGTSFILFTPFRSRVATWIDDIIHPSVEVTIPASSKDAKKTKEYKTIANDLLSNGQNINDVNVIKDKLKTLFNLRAHAPITKEKFELKWTAFHEKYIAFRKSILAEKEWNIKENLDTLKQLAIEGVILSDLMFSVMEKEIREEKNPVTTKTIAAKLSNNDFRNKFIYGLIINLYHTARARLRYNKECEVFLRSNTSCESSPEFYEEPTKNTVRKLYNTFIKDGFYLRYGNKALRNEFLSKDKTLYDWSIKDSKKTRKFDAYPKSW